MIGLCLPEASCGAGALYELAGLIYNNTGLTPAYYLPETMQFTHLDAGSIVVIVVLSIVGLFSFIGIIVQMTSLGDKYQPGAAA